LDNNSTVGASSIPLVVSTGGNITFANNAKAGGYFYAPIGNVTLNNNVSITGSIVGGSVNVNNNAKVNYPTDGWLR
jgi:hypothetical protein